jgi:hypothetical protein
MCRPCSFQAGRGPWKTPLRARLLAFPLVPLDDDEDPDYDPAADEDNRMTCIYCGRDKCEFGIMGFGDGKTSMYGVHDKCLPKLEGRVRKYLEREVGSW